MTKKHASQALSKFNGTEYLWHVILTLKSKR